MSAAPLPASAGPGPGRTFLLLGLGEAGARLIAFGVTIYLARVLGPSGYGLVGLAMAVLLYGVAMVDSGIETLGVREVAADPEGAGRLGAVVLAVRGLVGLGAAALLLVVGLFLLPQPEGAMLAAFGFTLPILALGTRWIHLGLDRAGWIAAARIAGEGVIAVVVLLGVRTLGDVIRVPLAQIAGDAVMVLLLALVLRRAGQAGRLRWQLAEAAPLFRRAWPLVAHALLGLVIFNSDFLFIRAFGDARAVGLYAAAYTLISFVLNLGVAYGQSLIPTLTRLRGAPVEQASAWSQAVARVFAVGVPFAVGGTFLAPALLHLFFGPEYQAAGLTLQILLWSVPVALLRTAGIMGLVAVDQSGLVLRTTTWAAVANLGLNLLLIPGYGIAGAAAATLLTELMRLALTLRFGAAHGLGFAAGRLLWRPLVASGGMAALLWLLGAVPVLLAVALGAAGYAIVLVALGGVRRTGARGWALTT